MSQTSVTSESKKGTLDTVACGLVTGLVTKSACAPLERIRTLYQIQPMFSGSSIDAVKYRSLSHTFKTIFREEGILGFWRGNGTNIIRAGCAYAIKFSVNEISKEKLLRRKLKGTKDNKKDAQREAQVTGLPATAQVPARLGTVSLLQAGMTAGFAQKFVSFPLDLLSVRIALGVNTSALGGSAYNSIWSAAKQIKATEGWKGFYKGFGPTLLMGTPYVSMQMTFHELYKRRIHSYFCAKGEEPKSLAQVFVLSSLSGSLATATAQCFVYPGDTIKKRMMANGVDGRKRLYRNSFHCLQVIYKREGIKAFYSGALPMLIRATFSGAIQFGTYEFCKSVIKFLKARDR